ncbi:MAG: guanylate kinase [Betaproteobacteria bacterium]|nr:guanylate kinase [Betaproteobacteria bacterium]NBY13972.1 guanylate kinase [Betaproteobacteria bacterium]NCA16773.1 guanylate kinase [Betaproteobacteria bacterium]
MSGQIIIVAAPSGAGKTSLVRALLEDQALGLRLSISTTTRPPRPGEQEGGAYFFVGAQQFEEARDAGEFIEWAQVHGNLYGTRASTIREALERNERLILEIDWQGARQIRSTFPRNQVLSIFILPPSLDELRRRLEGRGQDSSEVIEQRLQAAAEEMSHAHEFDHVIMNQEFSLALSDLKTVISNHFSQT